jgi:hypothetical protein
MRKRITLAERLDRNSIPEPNSGCRLWIRCLDAHGYGVMRVDGVIRSAHRMSYFNHYGALPDGLFVCHHCDNPCCIEPTHLFLGTPADNMRDRDSKGRTATGDRNGSVIHPESRPRGNEHWTRSHPERRLRGNLNGLRIHPESVLRGEAHGMALVTAGQVREIRLRYASGEQQGPIAHDYGIGRSAVGAIVRREVWKHL